MIENVTGGAPPNTCPWKAFADPVCADVLRACRWYDTGQITVFLGNDPPAHLVQGIDVYQAALSATRADRIDREIERSRKAKR